MSPYIGESLAREMRDEWEVVHGRSLKSLVAAIQLGAYSAGWSKARCFRLARFIWCGGVDFGKQHPWSIVSPAMARHLVDIFGWA
jgi:hypothetical protein